MAIIDFWYTIMLGDYLDKCFHIISFFRLFPLVLYFPLFNHWRSIDTSSSTCLSSINVGYFGASVFCWRGLVHIVVELGFYHSVVTKSSDKIFGVVLWRFDYIGSRCIAIPTQKVSNVIAFAYMTPDEIDCIFVRPVSNFFCSSLSSCVVDVFLSLVACLV